MPLLTLVAMVICAVAANAQTNSFTYQGRLTDAGSAANGNYDFQFALFGSVGGNDQIGSTLSVGNVAVNAGVYSVQLDFGANAFPGAARFLEIRVQPTGGSGFATLSPRQQLTSTPYAIRSLSATNADNATQLGGVAANTYVQTNDPRLTDARPPTAGSASYINNSLQAQTANFNVDGFGTVGKGFQANDGVVGLSNERAGVFAHSKNNFGVAGLSDNAFGLYSLGKFGVWSKGTSWFTGDTTPLSANLVGSDMGVAIGSSTVGYLFAYNYGTNTAQTLALNSPGGRVGIGTIAPDQILSVNGNASKTGGGSWLTFSDERLKNIKGRFTPGLKALMQLQPLRYEYKQDNALGLKANGEFIGFGAQAVQKVIPEAVSKDEKGYLLVNNDPIMLTMLNAIKEQQREIENLRATNTALNLRLQTVERRLRSKRQRRL
jgi:hypothetical protein